MPAAVKLACYNFSPKKQPDLLILNQKEHQPILFLNLCLALPVWRPHWCDVHRGQMDFWIRVYFMPSTYRSIYAVWWNECVDIWCVDVKRDVVGRDGHDHTRAGWLDGLVALWARDTLWPLPSNTGHTDTDTKIQIQICTNTNTHRKCASQVLAYMDSEKNSGYIWHCGILGMWHNSNSLIVFSWIKFKCYPPIINIQWIHMNVKVANFQNYKSKIWRRRKTEYILCIALCSQKCIIHHKNAVPSTKYSLFVEHTLLWHAPGIKLVIWEFPPNLGGRSQ